MITDVNLSKKLNILNRFLESYYRKNYSIPDNGELIFKCVNPNCNSHNKRKDKFCVNIVKENAHCWVCHTKFKNLGQLVEVRSPNLLNEWKELTGYRTTLPTPAEEIKLYYDGLFQQTIPLEFLKDNHAARQYLRSRYINLEKARLFNIRYVESIPFKNKTLKEFICVPSHSDLGIDYLFFRSIKTNFKINTTSKKTKIIFNDLLINWKKQIFLTEGVFDALRLFDYGEQSIPLLGSSLSYESDLFKKILQQKPQVVLALDPDALEQQLRIMNMLKKWNIDVYSMEMINNDIGASTDNEIKEALDKIVPYNTTYQLTKGIKIR